MTDALKPPQSASYLLGGRNQSAGLPEGGGGGGGDVIVHTSD